MWRIENCEVSTLKAISFSYNYDVVCNKSYLFEIKNNVNTDILRFILSGTLLFVSCLFFNFNAANAASETISASPCNMPDFDRSQNQGVFIWQQCSTGNWFFRVSAGGLPSGVGVEFNVIGTLSLSEPIQNLEEFSLELNDTLIDSDPMELEFNFRAFTDSQDGFNFNLAEGTVACLKLSEPNDALIVIGGQNTVVSSPVNIDTLDQSLCIGSSVLPPINSLLLLDE